MNTSPVSTESLIVLSAIERRGSFAAAAEELNKVPSALSYIVQRLEEQLGVTLFQKQGRRSVLTPAGKHLVLGGQQILEATQALATQTKSIANGWEPKIRIAIDSMFNTHQTFHILNQFLKQYPDIEIDIQEEVMNGGWEALIEDHVDLLLGAAAPIPKHKGIHAIPIAKLDRVFAVAPDHPLTLAAQPVPDHVIAKERIVVVHDSARTAIPWTKGITAGNRYFYVPTVDCKIRAQLAGIGCGFLPRKRVQPYIDSGALIPINIEHEIQHKPTEMYMAWKIVNQGKGLKALKDMFAENPLSLLESC